MTFANIYEPNTDNDIFYQTIFDSIEEFQNENIYFVDISQVLNQDLDTKIYKHVNHPKCLGKIIENRKYLI